MKTIEELAQLQVKLEIGMKLAGKERFDRNNKRAIDAGSNSETDWNRRIISELIHPMTQAIEAYIDYYTGRRGKPVQALAYIKLIEPQTAAFIALKTVLDQSVKDINLDQVIDKIGARVEDQIRFSHMEEHSEKYTAKIKERLKQGYTKNYKHQRSVLINGENRLIEGSERYEALPVWDNWGVDIHRHIGSMLLEIILEHVTFEGNPVFKKINIFAQAGKKFNKITKVVPTEYVCEWVDKYKAVMEEESPAYRPCIIPPLNWTTPTNGGYHVPEIQQTLPLVKCRKSQLNRLTIEQMPMVYKAINALQAIPWRVAKDVLQVVQDIKALGLDIGMPQREPLTIPPCPVPEEYKELRGKELKVFLTDKEWNDFMTWRREAASIYQEDNKRKAKYLSYHSTIGTANLYKDFDKIYFVYTMDSRGRIYAKSDTISPQGDDFQKGLIRFANGEKLGADGYHWLACHGAGKWGNDKIPFGERVRFIDDMKDDIRDFVVDPLTNKGWLKADKPWQFLNWCFEWSALMDWIDTGNAPEDFVSHIPCSQDGSCSGLQHYSAMLRDQIGGFAVNLVPGLSPRDIYAQVSNLMLLKLKEMALTGVLGFNMPKAMEESNVLDKEEIKAIANGLMRIKNGINRSLTKPPVMTKTYGSTFMRCKDTTHQYFHDLQVKEEKEAAADNRKVVPVHDFNDSGEYNIYTAEFICSKLIWESLNETVTSAVEGMGFIQKVAGYIAKAGSHMEWETPTGFIVEQHAYESKARRVKTQLLGNTRFTILEETKKLDIHKMQSSSSPNFVHSMDASHLVLAVCSFVDAKFTGIAVVHDDFSTHACNTGKLRDILRQTFVDLYKDNNVLAQLLEHNEALLLEEIDIDVPQYGTLDIEQVLESEYIFG